jgi:phage tail protein X
MVRRLSSSEHGAVFIHVAIGLLVLLGFGAFVVDYGALWISRGQAQTAADAGALAGAAAISFDGAADKSDRGRNVAWNVAHAQSVWGARPGVVPTSPYGGGIPQCEDKPISCIRVDAYRDGSNSSTALPTFLANLFGTSSQRTRAMAVAQTAPATGSACMKPWLIPDRWTDNKAPANAFDDPDDIYVAPTVNSDGVISYGTGWTPTDIGTELVLKPGNPNGAISPSDFFEIETATDYEESISGCKITKNIGDVVDALPGSRVGPTASGVEALLEANPGGAIVTIGMFNPHDFAIQDRQSGNFPLHIVNMLAFKIDHMTGGTVYGTIVGAPSSMLTVCTGSACPTSTGLVSVIRLIR